MRVIVALVVVSISFSLGGCSRPPQAEHPKLVRSKWVLPQSQRHVPKFTEASVAKTVTKASRPVSKRSKKFKTHLAKPARRQIEAPASADRGHFFRRGSLRSLQQPMWNHRRLFRQGSQRWLQQPMRNHGRLFRPGSLRWLHQPMRNHRCLFRQESLRWLRQPMRNHRRLFRQGSLNKHSTLVNMLYPRPSSWPPKKRQDAREFTRLQARTFAA